MGEKHHRKPINERETIEVEGVPQRLGWVAENHPEILMKRILGADGNTNAYWSALAKVGIDYVKALQKCEEWGLDAGIIGGDDPTWKKVK
jgi:hypothetical protein